MDTQKDPEMYVIRPTTLTPLDPCLFACDSISGRMTVALIGYSSVFMRYALAVTPKNYLLFGCHAVNFSAQVTQGYRFVNYWYMGGREKSLEAKAQEGLTQMGSSLNSAASEAESAVKGAANKVAGVAEQAKAKVENATR